MLYQKIVPSLKDYDAVICGGGFSGFAAAFASAREGLKTVIIEKGGCLGGVGTAALVNHILGVRKTVDNGFLQCVGGIFKDIENTLLERGAAVDVNTLNPDLCPHGWKRSLASGLIFDKEQMKLVLEQMLAQKGVKILYNTDIVDSIVKDNKVHGVVVHNKSGLYVIEGKYFVDATGDADVCVYSGFKTQKGDQSGQMSAASLEMHVEGVDTTELTEYMRKTGDVRFKDIINRLKNNGEWNFAYSIFISVKLTDDGVYMINTIRQTDVDGTDADSVSNAIINGRQENFKLFEIMKKHFPGFKNAKIREIASTLGVRETNRIVGEYTLSVDDVVSAKDFDDSVALTAYGWDMPNPKDPSYQPFENVKRSSPFTQIPYRCLLPKDTKNLIAIGRCISVEREVLGPCRVMGPCIAMGEAAGIATALALKNSCDYGSVDINELQNKITQYGGYFKREQVK